MAVRTVTDWRLLDCTHTEIVSSKHLCVSPSTRRIILVDGLTDPGVWPDSGLLTYVPGALAVDTTSKGWVIGSDGYVRAFTPSTLAVLTSTNVRAETSDWLAVNTTDHVVIAPGPKGGIVTLNSSGVVLDEAHGVLGAIVTAAYVQASRYLYCFDGRGNGAVVSVTSAGLISVVNKFTAKNCDDVLRARVNGSILAVACPHQIVKFSIAATDLPAYTSTTKYAYELKSVCDDSVFTPVGTAEQSIFGSLVWSPLMEARYTSDGYILLHRNGSVTLTDLTPAYVAPPPPGPALVVALYGNNGLMGTSPDGVNWTNEGAIAAPFGSYYVVRTDPDLWLIGGISAGVSAVYKASDGVTWVLVNTGIASDCVVFGAMLKFQDKYVVAGYSSAGSESTDGFYRYSTDLITWHPSTPGNAAFGNNTAIRLDDAATDGTTLVICGQTASNQSWLACSTDGINFGACTMPASADGVKRGIAYGGGRWVCGGNASSLKLWVSADGITWVEGIDYYALGFNTTVTCIRYSEDLGQFVMVDGNGHIATSTNGTSWTLRTSPFDAAHRMVWCTQLGLWVMVGGLAGNDGRIATSPDGVTWTLQTATWNGGLSAGIYGVAAL